jgi:hypothetical protein
MVKTNLPPQVGGMPQQITEIWSKYSPSFDTLLLLALLLAIVFSGKFSTQVLHTADTSIGRVISLGLVFFITQRYGWSMGVLAALLVALVISAGSNTRVSQGVSRSGEIREGFNTDVKLVKDDHKWFVERVLGESPFLIEEENIYTMPVQDLSRKGMGSTSYTGNVQNTSVSM